MASAAAAGVPHAAVTRRVLAKLKKLTPAQARATFVAAGIVTADGQLTATYGGRVKTRKSR